MLAPFRRALLQAAEDAYRAGELTRPQLFALRLQTLQPHKLAAIHKACCEEASARGFASSSPGQPGAFDWSTFLDFLRELLPLILSFFQ